MSVPFIIPIESGKVVKVYDGDTITVESKISFNGKIIEESPLYKISVRLLGIDTPEIKGKSEDEKIKAKQAKEALQNLILDKNVNFKNNQTEKYGRLLADVYLTENNLHVNNWMIENNYAKKYDGGKKEEW